MNFPTPDLLLLPEPEPSSEDLILTLKDARTKIENGWTQGSYHKFLANSSEAFCAVGALRFTSYSQYETESDLIYANGVYNQAVHLLAQELPAVWKRLGRELDNPAPNHHAVVLFNDDKGRTKEEVLDLFDRAIERVVHESF